MYYDGNIWMAKNENPIYLLPRMANRHGLICGATGTGKTITLKVMAEAFSDAGVPVFLSDIKGDLSGMSMPGVDSEDMQKRIARFGLAEAGFAYKAYPTRYWDVFGKKGTPVRATVSEMGPLLLSRIMELNSTQEGVLNIIFRIADDQNLLLLDLKDLRSMVQFVGDNAAAYKTSYGNISQASVGAIQRALLRLEDQGAEEFFGEPALDILDWMKVDEDGRGYINDLNCEELFLQPDLYATFLLWMLSEIYETLPEAGDLDKPKMVFFFDEAHLLFKNAPKELLDKVEQVVRLIRSKGVGIYFITQAPTDIPNAVLSQLGNRIEHALRAYSPADLKIVKTAAQTFRQNPAFDTVEAIQQLGTGEALVQFLDRKGAPNIVERAFILPPQSQMGVVDESIMKYMIANDEMGQKYNEVLDRESAYELLTQQAGLEEAMHAPVTAPAAVPVQQTAAGNIAAQAAAWQDSWSGQGAAQGQNPAWGAASGQNPAWGGAPSQNSAWSQGQSTNSAWGGAQSQNSAWSGSQNQNSAWGGAQNAAQAPAQTSPYGAYDPSAAYGATQTSPYGAYDQNAAYGAAQASPYGAYNPYGAQTGFGSPANAMSAAEQAGYNAARSACAAGSPDMAEQAAMNAIAQICAQYAAQVNAQNQAYYAQVQAAQAAGQPIVQAPGSSLPDPSLMTESEAKKLAAAQTRKAKADQKEADRAAAARKKEEEKLAAQKAKEEEKARKEREKKTEAAAKVLTSGARSFASAAGRALARGLLGSLKK